MRLPRLVTLPDRAISAVICCPPEGVGQGNFSTTFSADWVTSDSVDSRLAVIGPECVKTFRQN